MELCQAQNEEQHSTSDSAGDEKLKPKRIAKHDVRRYFTRMFFNAINSTNFITLLDYLNTFMKPDCEFALEYTAPFEVENFPKRIAATGPRISAFYLTAVGAMFPDMVLSLNTCQLVTSTAWPGTKLIISSRLQYTKIYDIAFDAALKQLGGVYIAHMKQEGTAAKAVKVEFAIGEKTGEKNAGSFAESLEAAMKEESATGSSASAAAGTSTGCTNLASSSEDRSTPGSEIAGISLSGSDEQREGKAKFQKTPTPDDQLVEKIHAFFARMCRLGTGLTYYADCKFTIMLDEQNHMENITVSAVQGMF